MQDSEMHEAFAILWYIEKASFEIWAEGCCTGAIGFVPGGTGSLWSSELCISQNACCSAEVIFSKLNNFNGISSTYIGVDGDIVFSVGRFE